ncbi:MAG: hypothetical protein IKJ26_04840 [Clostridia bacterium]|nr:hypothetical protein [Clostridia bacterium]
MTTACAKTTAAMDEALCYYYTPDGLHFALEKKDGLFAVAINDDLTSWASAIANSGQDNVTIVVGLKAPEGVEAGDWLMLKSGKNETEALKFIEESENDPQTNDFWKVTQVFEDRKVKIERFGSEMDMDFGILVGEYLSGVEYMVPLTHDKVYIAGWYNSNRELKQAIGYQKLALQFTHNKKSAFHVKGPQKIQQSRIRANVDGNTQVTSTVEDGVVNYVFNGNDLNNAYATTYLVAPEGATSYVSGNMKVNGKKNLTDGHTSPSTMWLNSKELAKSSNVAYTFYKWNEKTQQDEWIETVQLQINFETSDSLPWTYYEYQAGKNISPVPADRLIVENGAAKAGYNYKYDPATGHLNTYYQQSSASKSESAQGKFLYSVKPYQKKDETGKVIAEAKYFKYGSQGRTHGLLGKGANTLTGFSIDDYGWGNHPADSVNSWLPCEMYDAFRKIKPNDNKIAIYYPGRFLPKYSVNLMIIYWYENKGDTEPMHIEYLWETTTPFVAVKYYRPTRSEADLKGPVDRPYIIGPEGVDYHKWNLVVTTYYQEAENAQHFELRLEDDDGNPVKLEEGVTIYLPYPNGYDENNFFTLRHYSSDLYSESNPKLNGVSIGVTPTEYGLKFETQTFSPFILAWESNKQAPAVPKTGDEFYPGVMAVLLVLSAAVCCMFARRKFQTR